MDASKSITVSFNAFADAGPNALIFFAIQVSLGNTPVFDGLQPNVTQDVIPANRLTPGTSYSYFLFFENNAISADNLAQVTKDVRTRGTFATQNVPEPMTGTMIGCVMLSALAGRRRSRRGR
jgi:hypothetical protein